LLRPLDNVGRVNQPVNGAALVANNEAGAGTTVTWFGVGMAHRSRSHDPEKKSSCALEHSLRKSGIRVIDKGWLSQGMDTTNGYRRRKGA
jgi:hypothetical protein